MPPKSLKTKRSRTHINTKGSICDANSCFVDRIDDDLSVSFTQIRNSFAYNLPQEPDGDAHRNGTPENTSTVDGLMVTPTPTHYRQ